MEDGESRSSGGGAPASYRTGSHTGFQKGGRWSWYLLSTNSAQLIRAHVQDVFFSLFVKFGGTSKRRWGVLIPRTPSPGSTPTEPPSNGYSSGRHMPVR